MTAEPTIAELRADLKRTRAQHPRGSMYAKDAFDRLAAAAAAAGEPLDTLRRHSRVESERFFARTIDGPDGHVYWEGTQIFRRNGRGAPHPRRWWYEHVHGPLERMAQITSACGERGCISPAHAQIVTWGERRRRYSDQQILGALQVAAMQEGRTLTSSEWEQRRLRPQLKIVRQRFGRWNDALRQAGLTPYRPHGERSAAEALEALRVAHDHLGRWPTRDEFLEPEVREQLRIRGLPRSHPAITRHFDNSWPAAIAAARKGSRA